MQEIYSKDEDCFELFQLLKRNLGNKIDYNGTPYNSLFNGKYFSELSNADNLFEKGIPFYYKYCKNGFLRIQVGSSIKHSTSIGEKLGALSDFYKVLSEEFGEPTVFYTTKNDKEGLLSLHWSFVNKEEDIQKFREGTYFDDAETDKLIIIGDSRKEEYNLNAKMRKLISKGIGLPFELLPLVNENIEDFVKYSARLTPYRSELGEALKSFNILSAKYQLIILKSFLEKVNECESDYFKDEAAKMCNKEGHQFSKWRKDVVVDYEDVWIDHQLIPNYRIEKTVWKRTCSRCGYVETVEKEPQELIDEENQKKKQVEIKRLERRLKKLKEES